MLRILRYMLFPVSCLYSGAVAVRNWLYDRGMLHSVGFDIPVICVGNLTVGGTGKTPMVEYLTELIGGEYKVAILSRGYRRKTKGFLLAGEGTTSDDIGDEPMQLHRKYPDVPVAVVKDRIIGIPAIRYQRPEVAVIILDDAFQHRSVRAGMNILLTTFDHPYTRDLMLPTGNLRDNRSGSKRADVIVVTKCRPDMSAEERTKLINELRPEKNQMIFFTMMEYGRSYHLFTREQKAIAGSSSVLLISAIAKPKYLIRELHKVTDRVETALFKDHHDFSSGDIAGVLKRFDAMEGSDKIIVTTEKDAVKLLKFRHELSGFPVYVLPVRHKFLFDEGEKFDHSILNRVKTISI